MDELERDDVLAEQPENTADDDAVQQQAPDEALDEAAEKEAEEPDEELDAAVEEDDEDGGEDDEESGEEESKKKKKRKPIKGPGAAAWLAAIALMLFSALMLAPALWNTMFTVPSLIGLTQEAAGRCNSALEAYDSVYNIEEMVRSWSEESLFFGANSSGVPALTTGNFVIEREFVIWNQQYGPLAIAQSYPVSTVFPEGSRIPRSLKTIAAESNALTAIMDSWNTQLEQAAAQHQEDEDKAWWKDALELVRAQDKDAKKNSLYYDALELQYIIDYTKEPDKALAQIKKIKNANGSQFWMYEDLELYLSIKNADCETVIALCDARLKRNREDAYAMQYRLKALYLLDKESEAEAAAADIVKALPSMQGTVELTKAEMLYRQGKYDDADALCDALIAKAGTGSEAQGDAENYAMQATAKKASGLMLQGKMKEAAQLLEDTMEEPYAQPDLSFIYALMTLYAANGDEESYDEYAAMLEGSGYSAPQEIADLKEGKTTVEAIYTEGWGGYDV